MKAKDIEAKVFSGEKVKGKCHFCKKEVDEMFWCYGCHHFVCEECDDPENPVMGEQKVKDHKEQNENQTKKS